MPKFFINKLENCYLFMAKDFRQFPKQFKRSFEKAKRKALEDIAKDVLSNAQSFAPRDSGRLARSGRAYVGNEQVAGGNDTLHATLNTREDVITIIFSTIKKTGQGASVFYGSGWFDYALYWSGHVSINRPQHSKAFWIEKAIKSYNYGMTINRIFKETKI